MIFINIVWGWTVGLWVKLNLILEQWLLGGEIQSHVDNIESQHSEPTKKKKMIVVELI